MPACIEEDIGIDTIDKPIEHTEPVGDLERTGPLQKTLQEVERKLRFKHRLIELLQKIEGAAGKETSIEGVLQFAVDQICTYMHWNIGLAYLSSRPLEAQIASHETPLDPKNHPGSFRQITGVSYQIPDTGLLDRVVSTGRPAHIAFPPGDPIFATAPDQVGIELKIGYAFPVLIDDNVAAVLEFLSDIDASSTDALPDLMTHIGRQLGRIIERKRAEAALVQSREQLRSLAGRLASVREKERKRIAREVHDVLGQALTALRFDIATMKRHLPDQSDTLHEHIAQMDASVGTIIQTVRRIASDLRPGILDDLGIVAALEWQTGEFEARSGLTCSFTSYVDDLSLDPDRSTALFRIFQEILTNVARHAEASAVDVILEQVQDTLILRVKDNGRGIRKDEIAGTDSLGLLGMRERLLPWQGRVEFAGTAGEGTTVTVSFPLNGHGPVP